MMYGVPDLPYQGAPEMNLQKWSIQCTMFLTKQFVYVIIQTVAVASYLCVATVTI